MVFLNLCNLTWKKRRVKVSSKQGSDLISLSGSVIRPDLLLADAAYQAKAVPQD
jgi:hypothetical protein